MLIRRRPRTRSCLVAGFVLPSVALLASCSSGADSGDLSATATPFSASSNVPTATSNPSANTSPSPGSVISSDRRFNFVVPNGWNLTPLDKTVAYLSSATVAHDVAATIVVTRASVTPAPALDDTLGMATMQARQDGKTVAAAPDRTVGGEKAVSFTATDEEKNVDLKRTYVLVAHDKTLYSIVLTSAKDDATASESALNAFVASWTWTKAGAPGSTANGTTPAAVPTTTSTPASPSPSDSSSSGPSSSGSSAGSPSSSSKATAGASSPAHGASASTR